jgi:P pilus assembly chaperone PapD
MLVKFRNTVALAFAVFAASIVFGHSASAISVVPMVLDLSVAGKSAHQSFTVANDGVRPLPIEILVSRLELGLDGEQSAKSSQENFLIYPPQAMIPPGGSQVFRVQWIGDPEIGESQTYRFNVSQVPVKLPEGTSGIQIVMSFGVTVNVAPLQGTSDIVVMGAAPFKGKDGKRLTALTVKNPGNKHAYLKQSAIHLSGGGWSAEMTPEEIAQKVGLGIVQPGKQRRFILPVEVPSGVSKIQATVESRPDG